MIADEMEFEKLFSYYQISAASMFATSTNNRLYNSYYHIHNIEYDSFFLLVNVPPGQFLKGVCWCGTVQVVINVPVRG